MKNQIKYKINDDDWIFSLMSDEKYVKKHSTDSYAITTFDSYQVDFKESAFDLKTVIHELIHVHFKYCYTGSTQMSNDDLEEIFCELFSDRGNTIGKQSKAIYKKLKGKKRSR